MTLVESHHKAKAKYTARAFAIVTPRERTIRRVVKGDLYDAMEMIGLGRTGSGVDHGIVIKAAPGVIGYSVAADERAIFNSAHRDLFAVGVRLFAGPAVVYAHTIDERSVDVPEIVPVRFFDSLDAVEAAIAAGTLERPTMWCGPSIAWQWPQPEPQL